MALAYQARNPEGVALEGNGSTDMALGWIRADGPRAAPLGLLGLFGADYPGLRKRSRGSHLLHPGLTWGRPFGTGKNAPPSNAYQ